jgi:pimeloyl-ACP methyl ester carboxylesterase
MEPKTFPFDNLSLFYLQRNKNSSKGVLYIHGNSLNSSLFAEQVNASFLDDYTHIALDLPGHGKSSFSKNPDKHYSFDFYAMAIAALIEHLKLDVVFLVGHSLGGHITIQTIPLSNKIKGLMVFGTPPLAFPPDIGSAFLPNPAAAHLFSETISKETANQLAHNISDSKMHQKDIVDSILASDGRARSFLPLSISEARFKDEKNILEKTSISVLIAHGEKDSFVNYDYISALSIPFLYQNKIHLFNTCGHSPQIENPKEFNSLLTTWICAVS